MAKQSLSEIREEVKKMKDEELAVEIKKLRKDLFEFQTQLVTEKISDTTLLRRTRRQIARLLTEQNARAKAAVAS